MTVIASASRTTNQPMMRQLYDAPEMTHLLAKPNELKEALIAVVLEPGQNRFGPSAQFAT